MKKSFQSDEQITPKKVVQLLENGKIANLPLKNGAGKMNLKTKSSWAGASATTSSANCTLTFFDDTRALQTITDNSNLKMRVAKVAADFSVTWNPIYTLQQSTRLLPFKINDTEIMFVSKMTSGWGVELIFVTIDENDNLTFETVPLFTPAQNINSAINRFKCIKVDGTTNDYILYTQYSTTPFNAIMLPFRISGHTVALGNVFVFDAEYGGNLAGNIAMWDAGKIAVWHTGNYSNTPPLLSTFAINDLTISLLFRDTYPNGDLGTAVTNNVHMAKLSKGRIVIQHPDTQQSGSPVIIRIVEFGDNGTPIYSTKKTLVTNAKTVYNNFVLAVTGENAGFCYGKMTAQSSDPYYLKGTMWAWVADGDGFTVAPYFVYESDLDNGEYPSFSFNKTRNKMVIAHVSSNKFNVYLYPFEIAEQQHIGKALGIAESSSTVVMTGVVNGFQDLIPGDEYTYDSDGNLLSLSKYSTNKAIGRAVSQNSLLMYDYLLK
ncbi:hypothetical protein [Brevibacillus centrosporus]|uniref:hypothetical protein n=1 Tax=Brevibacillus centrosporus TaxID=54910 RepID=UPI003B024D43